jgi:ribosome-associated protein
MRKKRRQALSPEQIADLAIEALDDTKAIDVHRLDVRHLTTMMDYMIVASGRSDRHVRALADALVERCKLEGVPILGQEGQEAGEWILVDLTDVVVHVMLPKTRDFYEIEKLWEIARPDPDADRSHQRVR